eukprot:TRINITY_DN9004_c5_g1_i1.p1 TRINITY_DN9004_c5_g1~~TRINITY_DN9004_c5_g1_i1.p1  ORF type:complete len:1007 (+),score=289.56 TRINITY_DN9004_c5_g1_i1:76-3096(+)
MGIPAFFKWLIHKYPKTLVPAREEPMGVDKDGNPVPPDLTTPNPNGIEFDNLYIDMNGLVHPCCHDCVPLPKTEEDMMFRIFSVLDEVIGVVRPRKLIYLALDGCAPRAKMNQQRQRRFKAAKDAESTADLERKLTAELLQQGMPPPAARPESWDHNVITPGTPFMNKLTKALKWYIHERCTTDPYFQKVAFILSDSNTPGEGEHKIMNYVRVLRRVPGYKPNTRHCIYGLDADLIMLALAMHEPYFSVVREHIDWARPSEKGRCRLTCPQGLSNYDFLHCNVVREYLEADMAHLRERPLPMPYDFERCLDDFIFICFFVGNDFLPHLPSLDIREGGLDILIDFYNQNLEHIGGYLTECGEVCMPRVAKLLQVIGDKEEMIFAARVRQQDRRRWRDERRTNENRNMRKQQYEQLLHTAQQSGKNSNEILADLLANQREERNDVQGLQPDLVDYSKEGWKQRYYQVKFGHDHGDRYLEAARDAAYHFLVGVQWVLRYYYQGTAAWGWFYPFHYAPFAQDLCEAALNFQAPVMELGEPLAPYEQLMGVMPPRSRAALPKEYHWLMDDPSSPILDFFPMDFLVDTAGKRFAWMGTVLLPFIDEARLLKHVRPVHDTLPPDAQQRNLPSPELIFVHKEHVLAQRVLDVHAGKGITPEDQQQLGQKRPRPANDAGAPPRKLRRKEVTDSGMARRIKTEYPDNMFSGNPGYKPLGDPHTDPYSALIDGELTKRSGVGGWIRRWKGMTLPGQTYCRDYDELDVDDVEDCEVVGAYYQLPEFQPNVPRLLPGLIPPKPELTDKEKTQLHSGKVFEWIVHNERATGFPRQARAADDQPGPGPPTPTGTPLGFTPRQFPATPPPAGRGSAGGKGRGGDVSRGRGRGAPSEPAPGYGAAWPQPAPLVQQSGRGRAAALAGRGGRGGPSAAAPPPPPPPAARAMSRPAGAAPGVVRHFRPHRPPDELQGGQWAGPERPTGPLPDAAVHIPPPQPVELDTEEAEEPDQQVQGGGELWTL